LKRFLLLVLNFPLSRAEHLRCDQIEVRGLFESGVAYAQAWIPYFNGFWTPAFEAVAQFQSNILQVYVIPGLTRNPVVFLNVTPLDAGSGSGMTG
jgi:hypothetical protein